MKKCSYIFTAFLFLITSSGDGFGQRWIQHVNPQGLTPDERIHAMLEDMYGNIWLATGTGVKTASLENESARFQKLWKSFSRLEGDSLVHDIVNAISTDTDGCLWFGTYGGISRVDPRAELRNPENWFNYTIATTDSGLSHNLIEAIAVDTSGNKWFGTRGGGVCIALLEVCPQTQEGDPYRIRANWLQLPVHPESIPHRNVYAIAVDKTGAIWVGTQRGTVRYEGVDRTGARGRQLFNQVGYARTIFVDSRGYVWFGTFGNGVWRVHQDSLESWRHYATVGGKDQFRYVGAIAEDADGFMWFGRAENNEIVALSIVNPKTDLNDPSNWVDYGVQDGLSGGNIYSLLKDRDGNMWIGTEENGLTQFDDTWTKFVANRDSQDKGLSNNTIRALAIDSDDNMWVGTENGDLCKLYLRDNPFLSKNWTCYKNPDKTSTDNTIRSLLEDSRGYLWIGMQRGVCRVDRHADLNLSSSWLCFDGNDNIRARMVRAIAEDNQKYIWLGTDHGLWRTHDDSIRAGNILWYEQFDTSNGLAHDFINSLLLARDGSLWIGTDGGVSRINPASDLRNRNNWEQYTSEDGLIDNVVEEILEDTEGNIWFGTRGGVSKTNPADDLRNSANWKSFNSLFGLPSDVVTSISQPNKNEIWFGTQGGIGRLDLTSEKDWTIYTVADGLGSNSILSLAVDTSKGDIWIGTLSGGVTRYRPKKRPPETYLRNTYDVVSEDITSFEYAGTDLTTPTHSLLYSYAFDSDTNWSSFSSATSAQVVIPRSNRPLRHVFKVKAKDKDGNIDPTPAVDVFFKINAEFGGRVQLSDSTASITLHLAPGELAQGKSINITKVENFELAGQKAIRAYDITPKPSAFQIRKPVTLSISVFNVKAVNRSQIAIFRQNSNSEWIGIGGTVNFLNDTLTVTTAITEFGRYAVREESVSPGTAKFEFDIQPRIFSPSGNGQGLGEFANISFQLENDKNVTIRVYNLAGRLKNVLINNERMFRGINVVKWDGKDNDGHNCVSGLYIITIEIGDEPMTATVMVANKY